jgi:hypothetical protein
LGHVGLREAFKLLRDLIETPVELADLFAVARGLAARRSRRHVERVIAGESGLAKVLTGARRHAMPFTRALGFARFFPDALGFESFLASGTLGFAASFFFTFFTHALGFAKVVTGAFGFAVSSFARALSFESFLTGAFDFATRFGTRALDFESFRSGARSAARFVTGTLGFTRFLADTLGFVRLPGAVGFARLFAGAFCLANLAGARRRALTISITVTVLRVAVPTGAVAILLFSIRNTGAADRLLVLDGIAAAPVRVAVPVTLVVTGVWPPPAFCFAIEIRRARPIAVVGRLDHTVEPFADRHIGWARGRTRRLALFRTETSEIPRNAGFHSREPTS